MGRVAGKEATRYSEDFDHYSGLAKRTRKRRKVTKLRWSDLRVGKLLGEGNFSHVYEVRLARRGKQLEDGADTVVTDAKTIQEDIWKKSGFQFQGDIFVNEDVNDIWDLVSKSGGIEDESDEDADEDAEVDSDEENIEEDEGEDEGEVAVYALKHLHPQMTQKQRDFTASAIDLVLEAKLLGCLHHPNIIKLFGVTKGSLSSAFAGSGYFLLLDRLHSTLEDKIQEWIHVEAIAAMSVSGRPDKTKHAISNYLESNYKVKERTKLVDERLRTVALDVSKGMEYLHKHRVIFRDLKPSNVGFGYDGSAKVFDFGLAREVLDNNRKMTGNTGSLRYMAPEVNRREFYGLSADVYSFGVMLWEICTLQKPYKGMNKDEHAELVIHKGFRPKISAVPGSLDLKNLIQDCWSANAHNRPNFTYIRRALSLEMDKKKMVELEESEAGLSKGKSASPKGLRMKLRRQKGSANIVGDVKSNK